MILGAEPKNQVIWIIRCKVMAPNKSGLLAPTHDIFSKFPRLLILTSTFSEIGNKKKINGFGVWSGPFFLTWVHLKGSV